MYSITDHVLFVFQIDRRVVKKTLGEWAWEAAIRRAIHDVPARACPLVPHPHQGPGSINNSTVSFISLISVA